MMPSSSPSVLSQNLPNASLMYQTYTPTFGNINFAIQPSQTGEISDTFQIIPYVSLEAMVYMQQMQAQTSPTTVLPGQNTGQQNIQGTFTVTDNAGNQRLVAGYSSGAF